MRILLLTAATGGGHDMRANAFLRWVERLTDWEATIRRPLEQSHGLYRFGVGTYNWIQRTAPRLHHGYFGLLELAALHRNPKRILGTQQYLSTIESVRPDVIVSTHAHLNHGFFDLARGALGRSKVRCITYCGELGDGYGFSRHWVNPEADLFVGAVEETVGAAIAMGMPAGKAWQGGFMLFPEFYDNDYEKGWRGRFVREQFGLDADEFILLLATGVVGANNHLAILKCLERRAKRVQVVALCGNDDRTFASLESWGRQASAVRLKALRYRRDMSLVLRSVSTVVSRPGTGTTSEAIMSGCPLIMNGIGGFMPQETVTVRYGARHGIARTIRRAGEVGEILDAWEQSPHELDALKKNLRNRQPARHPRDILERAADCRLGTFEQRISDTRTGQGIR
jgi:processive 1,2-diacylglycerol beta-glucosyltransferase